MNRRSFLSRTTASAALTTSLGAADAPAPSPPPALVLTPPVAMGPRTDGVEFVWGVSRHARGWIELQSGDTIQRVSGNDFGYSSQGEKALRVRLDGLDPGRTYSYRAITESMVEPAERHESAWRTVRTLDASAAATRFIVWNDTHLNEATIRRLHEGTGEGDFLVWNGDICNDWTKEELIIPTLLHPAGTDFTTRAPLAFVWGNHDLRGAHGFRLADYVATPSGKSWYAFRSGPVAIVVLNTGEDKADDHPSFKGRVDCEPMRAAQAAWLRNEVLTNPVFRDAPYRIIICHIPLRWTDESRDALREYDNFSARSRKHWHEAIVEWKAQVVISGHMHETAWIPGSTAFPYAQLTGGGPQPDQATRLEVTADSSRLHLNLLSLDGKPLIEQEFPPLI